MARHHPSRTVRPRTQSPTRQSTRGHPPKPHGKGSAVALLGLGLIGYGLLILIGLLAHESSWIAIGSLAAGAAMVWRTAPRLMVRRRAVVLLIGLAAMTGTIGYNVWRASSLGIPEWAILCYGAALILASFRLDRLVGRVDVATIVAWSFPLLLAPLLMFSANAAFTHGRTQTALSPMVHTMVVLPASMVLQWMGVAVELTGNNMLVATPRGMLTLGVGLVCAGLYPMILYGGLLGLHALQSGMTRIRFAKHLAAGLGILWALNIVRIIIVTQVGIARGPAALQTVHAHIGWVLFALFISIYWSIAWWTDRRATGAP